MAAGAFLPDLSQVMGTGLMVLFYATPIVYTEKYVPAALRPWLILNPLIGALDAFRAVIIGAPPDPARLATGAIGAGLVLLVGNALFRRRYWAIRDVV